MSDQAGFRVAECLAWGRFLYVDDLVTVGSARFRGCGQRLLDWLNETKTDVKLGEVKQ